MRQVDEEVAKHNLLEAVPNPKHRRWVWAVGLPIALVVIGALLIPAPSLEYLRSLVNSLGGTCHATPSHNWKVNRHHRVVAYAEPFDVETRLKDDSPWKPESGEARV